MTTDKSPAAATATKAEQETEQHQPLKFNTNYAYLVIMLTTLWACFLPIPVSLHMFIMTSSIIYIGCFNSIHMSTTTDSEVMETKNVYMLPIIMSFSLGALYIVFKLFDKAYVNMLLKAYFLFFGVFVLGQRIAQILAFLLPPSVVETLQSSKNYVTLPATPPALVKLIDSMPAIPFLSEEAPAAVEGEEKKDVVVEPTIINFDNLDVVSCSIAACFGAWYIVVAHWSSNNIFGVVYSIQAIELLNLGSYFNGVVLLVGLFFYDIFWVFGTDVMVTVAKSFDAPIKLLFPQMDGSRPSLLGLGDIVIPGIFLALLLRFDVSMAPNQDPSKSNFTFFKFGMVGYVGGLATTVIVMNVFQAAQPALLYLVPTCIGASLAAAAYTGKFAELRVYAEGEATEDAAALKKEE